MSDFFMYLGMILAVLGFISLGMYLYASALEKENKKEHLFVPMNIKHFNLLTDLAKHPLFGYPRDEHLCSLFFDLFKLGLIEVWSINHKTGVMFMVTGEGKCWLDSSEFKDDKVEANVEFEPKEEEK